MIISKKKAKFLKRLLSLPIIEKIQLFLIIFCTLLLAILENSTLFQIKINSLLVDMSLNNAVFMNIATINDVKTWTSRIMQNEYLDFIEIGFYNIDFPEYCFNNDLSASAKTRAQNCFTTNNNPMLIEPPQNSKACNTSWCRNVTLLPVSSQFFSSDFLNAQEDNKLQFKTITKEHYQDFSDFFDLWISNYTTKFILINLALAESPTQDVILVQNKVEIFSQNFLIPFEEIIHFKRVLILWLSRYMLVVTLLILNVLYFIKLLFEASLSTHKFKYFSSSIFHILSIACTGSYLSLLTEFNYLVNFNEVDAINYQTVFHDFFDIIFQEYLTSTLLSIVLILLPFKIIVLINCIESVRSLFNFFSAIYRIIPTLIGASILVILFGFGMGHGLCIIFGSFIAQTCYLQGFLSYFIFYEENLDDIEKSLILQNWVFVLVLQIFHIFRGISIIFYVACLTEAYSQAYETEFNIEGLTKTQQINLGKIDIVEKLFEKISVLVQGEEEETKLKDQEKKIILLTIIGKSSEKIDHMKLNNIQSVNCNFSIFLSFQEIISFLKLFFLIKPSILLRSSGVMRIAFDLSEAKLEDQKDIYLKTESFINNLQEIGCRVPVFIKIEPRFFAKQDKIHLRKKYLNLVLSSNEEAFEMFLSAGNLMNVEPEIIDEELLLSPNCSTFSFETGIQHQGNP